MLNPTQIMHQTMQAGRYEALQGGAYQVQATPAPVVEKAQAMGYEVAVMADPLQELEDAMEELAFQFEEKAMKKLGERALGAKSIRGRQMIETIQKWQRLMPDLPGGAFAERLLNQLRQSVRGGATPNAVRQYLAEEGARDPSHQFALLDALEAALGPEEAELKRLLAEAKQALEAERGADVRAGFNLADEINARAASAEQMQELRDLYRGEVLGFKNPQACFRSLLAARGAGKLAESIEFLIKGCGVDLNSPSPSQSPEALARVLGDLQCVNVLTAVLDRFGQLSQHMLRAFGQMPALGAEQMTEKLLGFTEMPFVGAEQIQKFIGECGVATLLAQVYFCTDLARIVRALSSRLFETEDARQTLVAAVQDDLDELVMRQSEYDQKELDEAEKEETR